MHSESLTELAGRLAGARRVSVLTGAGVSKASGIPTFRDADGLWKEVRPEDLATPEAFRRDPKKAWEWYDWRRQVISECRPNPAHEVLAAWSRRFPDFTLITQNVDGLHERAGTQGIVRFHGSIWEVRCWEECPQAPPRWWDGTVPFETLPPPCPHCGGILRPGVVWFGEPIDSGVLAASAGALQCDVFLTVGTSSVVHPAASLTLEARSRGAFTAEVNPEATPATRQVDLVVAGRAEEALPRIAELLEAGAAR